MPKKSTKPTMLKSHVLKIMRDVGMATYCKPGKDWLRDEAPTPLTFKDFPMGKLRGYLVYFMYVNGEEYDHIANVKKRLFNRSSSTFEWNEANWQTCCDIVREIIAYLNDPPISLNPEVLYKWEVQAIIHKLSSKTVFCDTGLKWLEQQPKEITLDIIRDSMDSMGYFSFFCASIRRHTLHFTHVPYNTPLFDHDNLTPEMWAYCCGTIHGIALTLKEGKSIYRVPSE